MIRDMSMGGASKFKPGIFEETVSDDVNQLVINVSLDSDRIADIVLASGPQDDVEFTTNFEEIRTRILTAQLAVCGCHFRRDFPERSGEKSRF
ncbi:Uncharacterised protein [Cedecea neteri]|uniref:Uncharacterized protein n=1 Tax=Cedecea neteri TaxID=158822 RepID=A0A2X2SVY3_9ENTR|nr:Uncharacterised protein [Cedecea neteri]